MPERFLGIDTSAKSRSPFSYHLTSCSYVPIGDEPVARPSTESGLRMTCAEMIFAALRLMSL